MAEKCSLIRDLLPLYIEGLTEESSATTIQEHLAHCRECKDIYSSLKETPVNAEPKQMEDVSAKIVKRIKRHILMLAIAIFIVGYISSGVTLVFAELAFTPEAAVEKHFASLGLAGLGPEYVFRYKHGREEHVVVKVGHKVGIAKLRPIAFGLLWTASSHGPEVLLAGMPFKAVPRVEVEDKGEYFWGTVAVMVNDPDIKYIAWGAKTSGDSSTITPESLDVVKNNPSTYALQEVQDGFAIFTDSGSDMDLGRSWNFWAYNSRGELVALSDLATVEYVQPEEGE